MRDVIVFAIYLRRQHWCRHVSFDKSGRSETKDAQNTISDIDWPGSRLALIVALPLSLTSSRFISS